MTIETSSGAAVVDPGARDSSSYVDWPAIFGGIVLASGISLILLTFGSAVGLSFVGFQAREGAPGWLIGIGAGLWLLWVQISAFMAGGYLTGRLRRRHFDTTDDETDVRDGAHGVLVWAGGTLVAAILAFSGVGAVVSAAGTAAAGAAQAATALVDEGLDPNAYFIDTLFRDGQPADADAARGEATRILGQAALGGGAVPEADRTYLANLVAANTALTQEEAEARVVQVLANVDAARAQAVEAARVARNTTVISAFLLAATLLVSAIGAFWAAQKGGHHRDKNTVLTNVFRRF